ncbi:MAG: RNA polymerase sigma factor [bacterium]|jgi:RNA polymerase sigma-70 factor (ECF subfamily)
MVEYLEDAVYIEKVREGNREAFRELVHRYHGLVYHIAYSMCGNAETSRDAVQEVFLRAYRKIDTYQPQWSFKTWIRRITVNYLLDQRKKRKLETVSLVNEEGESIEVGDSTYDPVDSHMETEREQLVFQAVLQLPEPYQTIIVLRHFEDMSYEEIAHTMDIPIGTVMTQLHRARKKLMEALRPLQSELMF